MEQKGIAKEDRLDYEALSKEFEAFGGSLQKFCEHKKLSYTYTSKQFTKIEREQNESDIAKARKLLAKRAPLAAEKLGELIDHKNPYLVLKSTVELLSKVGITSNPSPVQVNTGKTENNIQVQFFLPENGRKTIDAKVIEAKRLEESND